MVKIDHSHKETEINREEEILARIAGRIREDSNNLVKLTGIDTVNALLSDVGPDEPVVNLADMQKDEKYQDIKSVVASTGTVYLYSDTYITEDQADILSRAEDDKAGIAGKVRENCKNLVKLTGVASLGTLIPGMEADKIEANVAEMLKDERYADIKPVVVSTGAVYLYSESYITSNYANILARAEANDPCATIADTVRDEARVYPRATRIEYFNNPIFNIDPGELEEHLARTLERPEFKDIKLINASTGARYLYSKLYMDEGYARSLVEWEEVGQEENP